VPLATNAYLAVQLINKQMTNYEFFCPYGALPLLNKLGLGFKKVMFET